MCGLESSGTGLGPVAGSYENCNGTSGSLQDTEFLDYFSNC
jgi:hypothetical protein